MLKRNTTHAATPALRAVAEASSSVMAIRRRIEGQLSPRERDVLTHTLAGLRSETIATLLELSRRTVEVHQARIKKKLGVRDKYELLRAAYRAGFFPYESQPVDLAFRDQGLDVFLIGIRENVDCIRLDLSHGYCNVTWRISMAIEDLRKLQVRLHGATKQESGENDARPA